MSPNSPSCKRFIVSRYPAWWRRWVPATTLRPLSRDFLAARTFWRAPDPRPPQPMMPTLMVWLVWAYILAATSVPAAAAPVARKSLRETVSDMGRGSLIGVGWVKRCAGFAEHRADPPAAARAPGGGSAPRSAA